MELHRVSTNERPEVEVSPALAFRQFDFTKEMQAISRCSNTDKNKILGYGICQSLNMEMGRYNKHEKLVS